MAFPTELEVSRDARTKRGKKPRPPGHVKVYKTAVFKIHNPSQHKRAMLKDSMKRAHLAYTRLLAHFLPDIERLGGMTKRERNAEMQRLIYRFVQPLPLGQGAKAGIRIDVQGQIGSYLELRNSQEGANRPTAGRLNVEAPQFDAALEELRHLGSDLNREDELRDEIARLSKSPRLGQSVTTATIAASISSSGTTQLTAIISGSTFIPTRAASPSR